MGYLFKENDDSDAGQHALDYRRGEIVTYDTALQKPHHDLEDSRQDYGKEEYIKGSQRLNGCKNDDRQSGCRSADTEGGVAQSPNYNTAHNAGNQSREQRSTTGQRNAQAKWNSHEKNHNTGGQIVFQIGK